MLAVPKRDGGKFQQAFAFDVHLLMCVDEDVGNAWILQQRLKWSEAEDLIENLVADLLLFKRAQQSWLRIDQGDQRLTNLAPDPLVIDGRERLEVDLVDQFAVQREFQLLVLRLEGTF